MSIDIYVLSNRALPDVAAWQAAIDAGAHPLKLEADMPISDLGGVLPATVGDSEAAFECSAIDVAEVREMAAGADLGGDWSHALVFYFWGDPAGAYAASVAAAAYARAVDGVIFDPQAGALSSDEENERNIAGFRNEMAKE